MTATSRMHLQTAAVVVIVVVLASVDWALAPAKASSWMVAIGAALGIGLVVTLMGRVRSFDDYSSSERGFLTASIVGAGLILAVSLLRHVANATGFSGGEFVDRGIGVGSGLLMLLLGNTMPKVLGPLTAKRCAPAQVQSLQRVAGWVFVLDGFVCIVASLALPVRVWPDVLMIATLLALLIVAIRFAWAFMVPRRSQPSI